MDILLGGGEDECGRRGRADPVALDRGCVQSNLPPGQVLGWPGLLNMPLAIVGLNLNVGLGFLALVLELVFEPIPQFDGPVHARHVRVGFGAISRCE